MAAIAVALSLVSYHPLDPSANVSTAAREASNLIGLPGAYVADAGLQAFGLAAFLLPCYLAALGWIWIRSSELTWPWARAVGAGLLLLVSSCGLGLMRELEPWGGAVLPGGVAGEVLVNFFLRFLNPTGTALLLVVLTVTALYLLTSFRLAKLGSLRKWLSFLRERLANWRDGLRMRRAERRRKKAVAKGEEFGEEEEALEAAAGIEQNAPHRLPPIVPFSESGEAEPGAPPATAAAEGDELIEEDDGPGPLITARADEPVATEDEEAPWDDDENEYDPGADEEEEIDYRIPTTSLLSPPHDRTEYDAEELQLIAKRIQTKFEEFKVGGVVTQINPGPVVTTFEFKPDPGVRSNKIVNLSEDLCLALECESILVERIPGKSTIGIEVPNKVREVITLREVLESRDFRESSSPLTVAMGKDINGRLKVDNLASMPHLLVAGSTGSGKSVMVNAFIMSILLRATPDDVRFIMIDPKTVELSLYRDVPHLLTPVITDMKKASNALKNATAEMERRLKLLAQHGVRNIAQYNAKIDRMKEKYEEENQDLSASLKGLPYILIIIDELADLMMLEGRQIEEAITRLAQMARAVGIHLVLATQRPSVDVITGLIKANIPARISFRLTSRIDSRTILDTQGAEALLGKGDMLYLAPRTQRLTRLHGPFITEDEIDAVAREWKLQAKPRYETDYLQPPADEAEGAEEDSPGLDDPMYQEAVKVVLEIGKASTSTLQRRLRLGYGRAARILDAMEKDGIVGPQDGSRPREVLKRPDWLAEVEQTQPTV